MTQFDWILNRNYRIDNTAEGCGRCNSDRWGNLVLCDECLEKKQKAERKQ